VGERRLQQVLDTQFGGIPDASGATEGTE